MAENSHIEWTTHTFNPWWGCMKVSEGCKNCYAESLDKRWNSSDPHWGPGSSRKPMGESYWQQPLKWDAAAKAAGVKAKVFCASMADVFEDHPDVKEWRGRLFSMIYHTPNLIWQLLTKRPENIMRLVPTYWMTQKFPDNVWIGTTVENQAAADIRIPILLKAPAKVRFLSCEPLLGRINLPFALMDKDKYNKPYFLHKPNDPFGSNGTVISGGIDWVICGGESGHGARPMHPDWARSLRDQCRAAGVPFFFKQWGEYIDAESMADSHIQTAPSHSAILYSEQTHLGSHIAFRVGKKVAGSLLDGQEWKEFPNA